jgi:preprotein translocase subunit SecD
MVKGNLKWKILLIVVFIAFSVWYLFPLNEAIKLGLDLQGGLHLVLEVQAEKVVENELVRVKDAVIRDLKKKRIKFESIALES